MSEFKEVRYVSPSSLKPHSGNPRTHTKRQIRQIAASLEQFGFLVPILVDTTGRIIAGHGRLEAAKLLGLERVPTLFIDHLSQAQIRAYAIADNRLAELSGWDEELLRLEFQYIQELDPEFDLPVTGFEIPEIDLILQADGEASDPDPADEVPEVGSDYIPISRSGDLFELGPHRLLVGDARDAGSYSRLLGRRRAEMVITDPPYNVNIDGHVSGLGRIQHREFAMASGEMSEEQFIAFLTTVLFLLARFSKDGSLHYLFMDWRHLYELLNAGRAAYSEFKNLCVWNKDNGGMGSLYRSKHELVAVFKSGKKPHINNVALGKFGRYRTNVWDYPGANSFSESRLEDLQMHPTVKPVAMIADAILDASNRGGIVLDPFSGSGTTIMAAERVGRRAYWMEIDPIYVDTTIRRWEGYTGEQARHIGSGKTFAEMKEVRDKEEATHV